MKKGKLDRFETKKQSEITPEHHRANVDLAVSLLAPIVEKSAADSAPVNESFDELLDQMRNGVKRQPVIVQMHDGRRVMVTDSGEIVEIEKPKVDGEKPTLINSDGDTGNDSSIINETLTPEQKQILAEFLSNEKRN